MTVIQQVLICIMVSVAMTVLYVAWALYGKVRG